MHIILGLLATIVTILVLLNRLSEAGFNLDSLNPFLWRKRRNWRKKYEANPINRIDNPMEATAILMLATAKADGDLSREDKNLLLSLFESEFKLSPKDAAGLLTSSAYLLGDGTAVRDNVEQFLAASKDRFSDSQAESAIELIHKVAGTAEDRHCNAIQLAGQVEKVLGRPKPGQQAWSG